jgi:phosphatidylinositol alpha-1,6-mannosyltransferase
MLICPSFFNERYDGIGRVSGAFFDAIAGKTGVPPFVISSNDPIDAVPQESGRAFGRNYARMMLAAAMSGRLARDCARTSGFPPVICMHLGLSPIARLLAARSGRPYVVFLHGVECWKPLRRRAKWGLNGAAKLLFNSGYTRRTFLEFNSWASAIPSEIVPLGVPVPALVENGSKVAAPGNLRILSVGRMSKAEYYEGFRDGTDLYKGFKQLILAVGLVAKGVPRIRLEIVGDGDARAELEEWLAGREEKRFVHLLGRVTDSRLNELYSTSDIFALPSEGEGFGLVFAEAMAHGLPCVCVNAGAAPEVVEDGVTGLVAKPRDVQDIAAKILSLADDETLRSRLSLHARGKFEEFYALKMFHERIIRSLELTEASCASLR